MRESLVAIKTASAEDTERFGALLATTLAAPQSLSVVYLSGDLGAGKTTLARGFLRGCGFAGPVRSPTYTLLEVYQAGDRSALHLDLYRLRTAAELEGLGLREWARSGFVWLVEWPERGAGRLPPPDLTVSMASGEDAHEINVKAGSPLGGGWLERLGHIRHSR